MKIFLVVCLWFIICGTWLFGGVSFFTLDMQKATHIREINQDVFDQKYGFVKTSKDLLMAEGLQYEVVYPFVYCFSNDKWKDSHLWDFTLNDHIGVQSLEKDVFFFWSWILIFGFLAPSVLLSVYYWTMSPALFSEKLLLGFHIFILVSYVIFLYLAFPSIRNYNRTYIDVFENLRNKQSLLADVLNCDLTTGLHQREDLFDNTQPKSSAMLADRWIYPKQAQESEIHNQTIFIEKKPFSKFDYIRINIDLFDYLFYAPDLTLRDFLTINPQMTYVKLSDGFWLGKYSSYITMIWINFCVYWFSVFLLVFCGFRFFLRKIHKILLRKND